MKTLLLAAAAALLLATPALAECQSGSPLDYAVMFKMREAAGEPISGLDELTLRQLGDRHWRVRKIAEWTNTLTPGPVQACYREWVVFYLRNIEEEVQARRDRRTPDMTTSQAQEAGHLLADRLSAPK